MAIDIQANSLQDNLLNQLNTTSFGQQLAQPTATARSAPGLTYANSAAGSFVSGNLIVDTQWFPQTHTITFSPNTFMLTNEDQLIIDAMLHNGESVDTIINMVFHAKRGMNQSVMHQYTMLQNARGAVKAYVGDKGAVASDDAQPRKKRRYRRRKAV